MWEATISDFTVFLVDDDQAILRSLDMLFRSAGHRTKLYCSAKTFLREHDGSIPGCVVLDLAMPEIDGLAVQDAFGHLDANQPIIFLTGEASIPEICRSM